VILVVGMRLGCLSHARLSARAIAADGLEFAGWIGNAAAPGLEYAQEYRVLLQDALAAPCLGMLPFDANPDASRLSARLRLPGSA
jgi:dethiobiotin synthetase